MAELLALPFAPQFLERVERQPTLVPLENGTSALVQAAGRRWIYLEEPRVQRALVPLDQGAGAAVDTVILVRVRIPARPDAAPSKRSRSRSRSLSSRRPLTAEEIAFRPVSDRIHKAWADYRPQDAPNDCRPGMPRGLRPCPWATCPHHLGIERTASGSVKLPHGHADFERLEETCSIDVAQRGGATIEAVGRYMGIGFDRVRQIERWTKRKLGIRHPKLRVLVE